MSVTYLSRSFRQRGEEREYYKNPRNGRCSVRVYGFAPSVSVVSGEFLGKEKAMQVWECKIVVGDDEKLPDGFDRPPRRAAIEAVEAYGIEVLHCFSGWGGKLDAIESRLVSGK